MKKIFQFTLPCGERPLKDDVENFDYIISIHAPVWGATIASSNILFLIFISIHAPVWGATAL